jgi:CheY-like chemotaxis protein
LEVEIRGYEVEALRNAELALAALTVADDIELVLIDVMLNNAIDAGADRVGATSRPVETGLALLDQLIKDAPHAFPDRALLLSHTTDKKALARAKKMQSEFGVELIRKANIETAYRLGEIVDQRIADLGAN